MNVLLTCAGRRTYLVEAFQRELEGRGAVFAADHNAAAATGQEADRAFVLPSFDTDGYVATLLDLCREYDVGLLVSLNDFELGVLALEAQRFLEAGVALVVSSPAVIDTCLDKWATRGFLAALDLPVPLTYSTLADASEGLRNGEVTFPLVVKPRWGTNSQGLQLPQDDEELELAYRLVRVLVTRGLLERMSRTDPEHSVLIQQHCSGQEYGIDVVNDLRGRYVCTFARRKLAMRGGETDQAVTISDDRLESLGEIIGTTLGHVGVLDCDVIVQGSQSNVLDMNPRFGGGYPFSHVAGANVPAALIAWASGEEPEEQWLTAAPDVMASKTDRLVVIKRPSEDASPQTCSTVGCDFRAATLQTRSNSKR